MKRRGVDCHDPRQELPFCRLYPGYRDPSGRSGGTVTYRYATAEHRATHLDAERAALRERAGE